MKILKKINKKLKDRIQNLAKKYFIVEKNKKEMKKWKNLIKNKKIKIIRKMKIQRVKLNR